MKFTVFGGSGFVGTNLIRHLEGLGHDVAVPARAVAAADLAEAGDLGHVIYAIGVTGNFRGNPGPTIDAHVNRLVELIGATRFSSWTYLSSTRLYGGLGPDARATETDAIPVVPSGDSTYDLSKLLGEALCLSQDTPTVRIARLSNVYGPGQSTATFLGAVLKELRETGSVTIGEAPQSSKDYVSIDDVCALLPEIAIAGSERIYNVASGSPTTHEAIADVLTAETGQAVSFAPGGKVRRFPTIAINRIRDEFGFRPRTLIEDLPGLIARTPEERTPNE